MGRISDEDIARVRDATDLVALVGERVVLKHKGRLWWGNCPFHGEKTPSFKIDPATQLWHCFGCGLGGDAFGFTMRIDNVDFPDAVRLLADRAHVEIHEESGGVPRGKKERLYAALEEAAAFYHRFLTGSRDAGATKAREYLGGRGFGSQVAKTWRLGYAPGRGALVRHLTSAGFTYDEIVDANLAFKGEGGVRDRFYERVMFPIADLQGRIVGFGGRVLGAGEPKYLNTSDTPVFSKSRNMYAIEAAKGPMTATGTAIVVEGYTDVIALHSAGLDATVATLGTALTREHVKLLGRFARKVVYLFDGDEAGMRAADRAVEFVDAGVTPEAGSARVELLVAVIPDGLDPADYVAAKGADAMRAVVEGAQPLLQFAIDRRLARWDLDRPEERTRALRDAAAVLAPIKDSLLADDYSNYIADRLFADFNTVKRAVAAARVDDRETGPDASQAAPGRLGEAVSPELRTERELLALLVGQPRLRGRARKLLADNLLSDPGHVRIAEVIADSDESVTAAVLAGRIEAAVPGAAAELSGASATDSGVEEPEEIERDLVRHIKEFELERRIAAGKARLKRPESFKDSGEEDELFREVSALQRELDAIRRGTTAVD